jgi:hypothetical protein
LVRLDNSPTASPAPSACPLKKEWSRFASPSPVSARTPGSLGWPRIHCAVSRALPADLARFRESQNWCH